MVDLETQKEAIDYYQSLYGNLSTGDLVKINGKYTKSQEFDKKIGVFVQFEIISRSFLLCNIFINGKIMKKFIRGELIKIK